MNRYLVEFSTVVLALVHYKLEVVPPSLAWMCYGMFAIGVLVKFGIMAQTFERPTDAHLMPPVDRAPSRSDAGSPEGFDA